MGGSGARTWFNGWINIFFPYIEKKPNRYMVPYSSGNGYVLEGRKEKWYSMFEKRPDDVQGPDCADFPKGLASAPVVWKYLGREVNLKFKAGFIGATQEQNTGAISPLIGWFIAHNGDDEKQQKASHDPMFDFMQQLESKVCSLSKWKPPTAISAVA